MTQLLKRYSFGLMFIAIICIATVLRLYKLDQVPSGMSWDEAAIGYNGYAIWTVHRDEWLHFMPFSFKSFGDFKAPFAIYLNGIFTVLFGLQLWVIRLPFVIAGVASIIGMAWLIHLLFQVFPFRQENQKNASQLTVLGIAFIITTSPWHIFFTRAGFESGMAMGFMIWGMCFFLQSLHTQSKRFLFVGLSVISFVLGLYTYHSAKIFLPIFFVVLFAFFFQSIKKHFAVYSFGLIFGIILLTPLVYDSVLGQGTERFSQTSLFSNQKLTSTEKLTTFVSNYAHQFSPAFLFAGETTTLRHGDGHWGVLFLTDGLLLIATTIWFILLSVSKKAARFSSPLSKIYLLGVSWFLIGLLPAAIGMEIPHANRALLSYPGFLIIEALGIFFLLEKLTASSKPTVKLVVQALLGTGFMLHVFFVVSFTHDYFSKYSLDSAEAFQYGYKEVFDYVLPRESQVEKVLITSKYGQPYIYTLLYRHTNAILYHGGALSKYEYPDTVNIGDVIRKNAIVVATPEELDPSIADQLILAPSGEVRFVIINTAEHPRL